MASTMTSYTPQFGYPYTSVAAAAASQQLLMSTGSPSGTSSTIAGPSASSSSSSSSSVSSAPATAPSESAASPSGSNVNIADGPSSASASTTSPCCDTGRPLMTDPVTGQTVCSCQYERLQALQNGLAYGPAVAARLAAVSSAVTGVSGLHGVYSAAYPSSDQNPYPSLGMDSTAFYSSLANPYSLKEGTGASDVSAWPAAPGLQSAPGYYPYDPTLAAYGYGASYDLAARRKNATRESTATLKAWLSEHKKNPYPTKGEKIMLAIITKMTLTQVSTWFANARRRLKKENKMTWEPKNRNDDDDDDCDSSHSDDESSSPTGKPQQHKKMKKLDKDGEDGDDKSDCDDDSRGSMSPHSLGMSHMHPHHHGDVSVSVSVANLMNSGYHHQPNGSTEMPSASSVGSAKPKIWSLADTAACKTPPPPSMMAAMLPHPHLAGPPHAHPGHPAHSWFAGVNAPLTGSGSMMNGMPNMAAMNAKMAAGFGSPYGRYPALPGYGANAGYPHQGHQPGGYYAAETVQTDTPPQTPPNLKVNSALHHHHHQQQYHPYASPQQQQQHRLINADMGEMLSPGRHLPMAAPTSAPVVSSAMAAPQPPSDATNSTAFRPVYRTSPIGGVAAGYATSS